MAETQNPLLQRLWNRIRHDEIRHSHWLQMALAQHVPGGMGQMGGMAEEMEEHMQHMQEGQHVAGAAPSFQMGQVVVPSQAHMPEHVNRAAEVLGIVRNQPFYVLNFGDGHPHRWYAQDELQAAPPGTRPGQHVTGTRSGEEHS